jgi:hypothetical protein
MPAPAIRRRAVAVAASALWGRENGEPVDRGPDWHAGKSVPAAVSGHLSWR